jgi:electron transfer flavoprotein alpha subunit
VWLAEHPDCDPGTLAWALAPVLAPVARLLLPDGCDGAGLAPRLAAALDRPLLAGARRVLPHGVEAVRHGGRLMAELTVDGPFVATVPVSGPVDHATGTDSGPVRPQPLRVELPPPDAERPVACVTEEVLPPEPGTADLRDAPRILGAGAGLGLGPDAPNAPAALARVHAVAALLDATVGATRVVTDAGWLEEDRQIGITGAVVDPELYLAFGVSGASQHLGGLGRPRHVVSVNTDPFCPMTAMADLGLVCDAVGTLAALADLLEERRG